MCIKLWCVTAHDDICSWRDALSPVLGPKIAGRVCAFVAGTRCKQARYASSLPMHSSRCSQCIAAAAAAAAACDKFLSLFRWAALPRSHQRACCFRHRRGQNKVGGVPETAIDKVSMSLRQPRQSIGQDRADCIGIADVGRGLTSAHIADPMGRLGCSRVGPLPRNIGMQAWRTRVPRQPHADQRDRLPQCPIESPGAALACPWLTASALALGFSC